MINLYLLFIILDNKICFKIYLTEKTKNNKHLHKMTSVKYETKSKSQTELTMHTMIIKKSMEHM